MWLFTHYSANGMHWGFTVQRANGGQVGPTHATFCEPVLRSDQHRVVLLLNHCACPEQTRLLQARPNLLLTPYPTPPAEFCICGFSPAVALVARLILNTAVASLPLGTHTNVHESKISESSYSVQHYYPHPDTQRTKINNSRGALIVRRYDCVALRFTHKSCSE